MALAIFDARPDRVVVGEVFDTNKKYVYRDTSGVASPALAKIPTQPTIVGLEDSLTYSFDGGLYYVNTNLGISPTSVVIGTI
jgi:hypothetical protein